MNIASGVAFKQDFKIIDYTLSADLHPLNYDMDFTQKLHLGAELGLRDRERLGVVAKEFIEAYKTAHVDAE